MGLDTLAGGIGQEGKRDRRTGADHGIDAAGIPQDLAGMSERPQHARRIPLHDEGDEDLSFVHQERSRLLAVVADPKPVAIQPDHAFSQTDQLSQVPARARHKQGGHRD
jgi:hypothetical protein